MIFLSSCFFSQERRFIVLEYDKTNFSGLYWQIKKIEKMANFEPKPWSNPFGEMSIFSLIKPVVFIT